jgi:hypothetical protein
MTASNAQNIVNIWPSNAARSMLWQAQCPMNARNRTAIPRFLCIKFQDTVVSRSAVIDIAILPAFVGSRYKSAITIPNN